MTQRYAPSIDFRNTLQTIYFLYKLNVILRLPNLGFFLFFKIQLRTLKFFHTFYHYALFKTLNLQKSSFYAV